MAYRYLMAALVAALMCTSAGAVITISHYKQTKNDEQMQIYVQGIGHGYLFANAMNEYSRNPKLYCPPPQLGLNVDNYLEMLETEIRRKSYPADAPLAHVLLQALRHTFPCK